VSQSDTVTVRNMFILIVVILCLAMFIAVMAFLWPYLVAEDPTSPEFKREAIAERIKPVGMVNTGEVVAEAAPVAAAPKTGQEIYESVCTACHLAGVLGAPKLGDEAGWAPRLAKGVDTLIANAINGIGAMPARGGNPALTDDDIKRTVDYMLASVGVGSGETASPDAAAPTASPEPAATEAAATEATPATDAAATQTAALDISGYDLSVGERTYKQACGMCHQLGIAGAPKFADAAQWEPRLAKGLETLITHSIEGFQGEAGVMPPKGGNLSLADEDVKAAVAYMVANVQ